MDENSTALLEFLQWLDQQDWISSHIKAEFLNHLQAKGLDEKSVQYIRHALEQGEALHNQELQALQTKLNMLRSVSNLEPKLTQRQVSTAKNTMHRLVDEFNTDFKAFEAEANQAEEAHEASGDAAKIEALKASL